MSFIRHITIHSLSNDNISSCDRERMRDVSKVREKVKDRRGKTRCKEFHRHYNNIYLVLLFSITCMLLARSIETTFALRSFDFRHSYSSCLVLYFPLARLISSQFVESIKMILSARYIADLEKHQQKEEEKRRTTIVVL